MTVREFNEKYNEYLEERFYGLSINSPDVIKYLDNLFETELIKIPDFKYYQIKLKWGNACVYTTLPYDKNAEIQEEINNILSTIK